MTDQAAWDQAAQTHISRTHQASIAETPLFKDQITEAIRESTKKSLTWDNLLNGNFSQAVTLAATAAVPASVKIASVSPLYLPHPGELEEEQASMAGNALTTLQYYDDTWATNRGGLTSFYCNAPQADIFTFLEAFDTYNTQVVS